MVTRFTVFGLLVATFCSCAVADDSTAKNKRILYVVKHAKPEQLAKAIGKQFNSDVNVDVFDGPAASCLSIRGPSTVVEQVTKMLEQLDQAPKAIAVDIVIVDVGVTKGDDGKLVARKIDLKELSGTTKEVVDKLDNLAKSGAIDGYQRIESTVLENQPTRVFLGASRPAISGFVRGEESKRIARKNTQTEAHISAWRTPEKDVVVDFDLVDDRMKEADDGSKVGNDDNGTAIPAMEILTAKVASKATVAPGHANVVDGVKTQSRSGKAETVVIVAARIVDVGSK